MNNSKGFTLIEILMVVVILGLLSGLVIPRLVGRTGDAKISIAKTDIEAGLAQALDLYELDNDRYPSSLRDLVQKPSNARNWKGPYLKKGTLPKDPWGNEYVYKFPASFNQDGYDLFSLGPDGVEGGDDITNWDE